MTRTGHGPCVTAKVDRWARLTCREGGPLGIQSDRARLWMHRFASHASSGRAVLNLDVRAYTAGESAADHDLLKRGQGLILDTEDDLANVPHAPEYRISIAE
jgi:hypothetical protein